MAILCLFMLVVDVHHCHLVSVTSKERLNWMIILRPNRAIYRVHLYMGDTRGTLD